MKVSIQEIPGLEEEEVIIKCREMNEDIMAVLGKLKSAEKQLTGLREDEIHKVALRDVYYFETVDSKSFFYCKESMYESKLKLYEFEELATSGGFFRASKSVVLNAMKISHIKPSLSGRFEAVLENNERILVSRQYVPDLKRQLGI